MEIRGHKIFCQTVCTTNNGYSFVQAVNQGAHSQQQLHIILHSKREEAFYI